MIQIKYFKITTKKDLKTNINKKILNIDTSLTLF